MQHYIAASCICIKSGRDFQSAPQSNPFSLKQSRNFSLNGVKPLAIICCLFNPSGLAQLFISTARPQECKLIEVSPRILRMLKHPSQVFNSLTHPVEISALNAAANGATKSLLQYILLGITPISSSVGTSHSIRFGLLGLACPYFFSAC